jgi:hypothetical protein
VSISRHRSSRPKIFEEEDMRLSGLMCATTAALFAVTIALPTDASAGHRRGHRAAVAIGVGAAILGAAALASGARASECRYVERCSPKRECWYEGRTRVCETVGESCRSVKVCD